QTVAGLAAVAGSVSASDADQGPVAGPVPLTPIQRRYLGSQPVDPHYFTQSALLRVRPPLGPAVARPALGVPLRHHDARRLRFSAAAGEWRQWCLGIDASTAAPWSRLDLSALEPARGRAALE